MLSFSHASASMRFDPDALVCFGVNWGFRMRSSLAPHDVSGRQPIMGSRLALEFGFLPALRKRTAGCGLFAVSEISKGIVIVWVGDFATADAIGELISALSYPAHVLRMTINLPV